SRSGSTSARSSTRVSSARIEASRAAMISSRLLSPSMRSVKKSGSSVARARLVEERLLGLQFLAERKARVAGHGSLQAARAWHDEHEDRRGGDRCRMLVLEIY